MTIGDRIRCERERLKLTQEEFAGLAGLSRRVQVNYEKNERSPDTAYLTAIAKGGANICYILSGDIIVSSVTREESLLLDLFRQVDGVTRKRALAFLSVDDS